MSGHEDDVTKLRRKVEELEKENRQLKEEKEKENKLKRKLEGNTTTEPRRRREPEDKEDNWNKQPNYPAQGFEFEVHEIALCYLRCLAYETFQLRSNVEHLRPFDDLVLTFTHQQCSHTYLVQLKHTKNKIQLKDLHKEKGDFSLRKYCEGYAKLMGHKEPAKQVLGDDFDFDNRKFVLLTSGSLQNCEEHLISDEPDQALDPHPIYNGGAVHRVTNINCHICASLKEEFLEKFRIYEKQPNLQALRPLIKNEIRSEYCQKKLKGVYWKDFVDKIREWSYEKDFPLTIEYLDTITKEENEMESRGSV